MTRIREEEVKPDWLLITGEINILHISFCNTLSDSSKMYNDTRVAPPHCDWDSFWRNFRGSSWNMAEKKQFSVAVAYVF